MQSDAAFAADAPVRSRRVSTACVVVGAGRGERLSAGLPKAFVELAGRPLLGHAVDRVAASGAVDTIILVVPAGGGLLDAAAALLEPYADDLATGAVVGGKTRRESVAAGLAVLPDDADVVLVHDAARCLAPPALVAAVVAAVRTGVDAVVPGVALADTVKEVDRAGWVRATPDRTRLRAVQTPQGFRRSVLLEAHAASSGSGVTDDAGLVEALGRSVQVVPGHVEAFKITDALDLRLAEALLAAEGAAP